MSQVGLSELFSATLPSLQQAVRTAGDSTADPEEQLAAVAAFSECLADLWPLLESKPYLCEFLEFLEANIGALPERAARGDEMAAIQIIELMALLEAHLSTPDDEEIVSALLEMASLEIFDPPLPPETIVAWSQNVESADRDERRSESQDELTEVELASGVDNVFIEESTSTAVVTAETEDEHTPKLSAEASELLAILAMAISEGQEEFLTRIAEMAATSDADARTFAAQSCQEILNRFATASAQAGLVAFSTLCASLGFQIAAMSAEAKWPAELIDALMQLPQRMLAYLERPLDVDICCGLVEILQKPHWIDPLSTANAESLAYKLKEDPLLLEADSGPSHPVAIEDKDLSLAPAADIDPIVLASFRREGPDLAFKLVSVIQSLVTGGGDEETLHQAQRWAHTIKGSANICGVNAIAVLSHYLEDLLEFLTIQGLRPSQALGDTLAAGADTLALMFDMFNGVETSDPDRLRGVMQEVLDWANRIDREGADALLPAAEGAKPWSPPRTESPVDTEIPVAPSPPKSQDEPIEREDTYLQVSTRTMDDLLRFVGELSVALSRAEEQLSRARLLLSESGEIAHRTLLQIAELDNLVDLRGLGLQSNTYSRSPSAFDPLELEQYNEMYEVTRWINEGVSDTYELGRTLNSTLHELGEAIQHQARLQRLIRRLAMETRLVQVDSIVPRLQRAVRQTCRATGKEAELHVMGSETQVDGEVLDRIMPALMHLVRNAIDHGIELPDQREQLGKPRVGRIEIRFAPAGDQIVVTCSDDGRGLDLERIRAKAISAGLLAASAMPTDQELMLLTLQPGFSTREVVTQISGRGVGMDVVATIVHTLNGTLAIESQPGAGYRIQLRLPASRLTLYCLLLRHGDHLLAVPANEVRSALLIEEGECVETPEGWQFCHEGHWYPLRQLDPLFGRSPGTPERRGRSVLILSSDRADQAILIDALLEGRELVVMKPGSTVPKVPGLMAVSVLGDGTVVPILDMRTILRVVESGDLKMVSWHEEADFTKPLPTVLVVDDSISMRRLLSQLVIDAGYRALTASNGMDALQILGRERVDLLLVDMEMPRMNGLELSAHLRSQPDTQTLPIGMITSRSSEKHQHQAAQVGIDRYFVKPYRDDDVIEFIQQKLAKVS